MSTESSDVYRVIQKIIGRRFWGVRSSLSYTLEVGYVQAVKRELDYKSLGVDGIAGLLKEMHSQGMVLFFERPEDKREYVMCTQTLKNRHQHLELMVQDLLDEHGGSIPRNDFEASFKNKFQAPLDYHLFALKDFDSLCEVLNLVPLSEEPESKKTHVMSARTLKTRQEALKLNVQKLLDAHGGSIPLTDFEVSYMDKFKAKLYYHYFGLKDFDHLCEVLNMVVEAANFPGEKKVMKAGEIYNSRKRKMIL